MSNLLVEQNINKARSLVRKGKASEALDLLNSIIKKFPNNKRVQFVIQKLNPSQQRIDTLLKYYQNRQLGSAEQVALSLTQEFPSHPFGWKALGVILGETGRKVEALSAHQKAVEAGPKDAEIHNNFGNALRDLGRFDKAEVSIMEAIKIKPDNAEFHNNLGSRMTICQSFEGRRWKFR